MQCQLLQRQIQEKKRMLELCYPDDEAPTNTGSPPRRRNQERGRTEADTESSPRRHHHERVQSEETRPREKTIHIDDGPEDEYEDDYRN